MFGQERRDQAHGGFRPEIQGLRAIAVLAVMFYHAHLPGMSGGFIGVDVFFVISGYLICGLLHRELAATGRIALGRFWLRRARRLLPNAALTLLSVLVATALLRPANSYVPVASDVASAALSFANIRFAARAVGYFADDVHPSPVLHFWSLSVEEQFYIAWPLLLAALVALLGRQLIRWTPWLLAAICAVSFGLAQVVVEINQPLAFYHMEMRAWQLAAGGLLAALEPRLDGFARPLRIAAAWLGLAGVVAAATRLNGAMTYPGAWALLPTVSTLAILAAPMAERDWLSPTKLLGRQSLGWLGDRSYSLYLWHWPALVFTPLALPGVPFADATGLVIGSLMACVSYHWIERPLHHNAWPAASFWPQASMAVAAIALVLCGSAVLARPFWHQSRTAIAMTRLLQAAAKENGQNVADHCHLALDEAVQPACRYGAVGATRRAVLLGDSHASQWFPALDIAARSAGWQLQAWTKSSCPMIEIPVWYAPKRAEFTACDRWRSDVLASLINGERPDIVFLSNRLDYSGYLLDPVTRRVAIDQTAAQLWRIGYADVVRRLSEANIKVVLIRDTPRTLPTYADCLVDGGGARCDRSRSEAVAETPPEREVLRGIPDVALLDLSDRICTSKTCPLLREGRLIYRDSNHLAEPFAASLANAFAPYLAPGDSDPVTSSVSPFRGRLADVAGGP